MLEYEEELRLSDLLVARRAIKEKLKQSGDEPTKDQQRVLEKGDRAASQLTEAYLPYIQKSASLVHSRIRERRESTVDFDDLVHEGVVAAIRTANSFNARGKNGRPGVRFATYAGMAITKAMNRYVAKDSTPMYMEVEAIQHTWGWVAARDDLKSKLGRNPTDEEIQEVVGNIRADYVAPNLPNKSTVANIDDNEFIQIKDDRTSVITIQSEYDRAAVILSEIIDTVMPVHIRESTKSRLGLDIMRPRDVTGVAEHLGISKPRAKKHISLMENIFAHPRYRVWILSELERLDPDSTYLDIGTLDGTASEADEK